VLKISPQFGDGLSHCMTLLEALSAKQLRKAPCRGDP
jgi:hypothetical protein